MGIETSQMLAGMVIGVVNAAEVAAVVMTALGLCGCVALFARETRHTGRTPEPSQPPLDAAPGLSGPALLPRSAAVAVALVLLIGSAIEASAQSGDMNCDGAVNGADVSLFVEAVLATSGFGGCDINRAEMNGDGLINGLDAQAFVDALMMHPCGAPLTLCNGICVDTSYNNGHCGGCGILCAANETCVGGICEPSQPCPDCAQQ